MRLVYVWRCCLFTVLVSSIFVWNHQMVTALSLDTQFAPVPRRGWNMVAFGDFDNDKRMDVFVVDVLTRRTVEAYQGTSSGVSATRLFSLTLPPSLTGSIISVSVLDFNFDGNVDLLIQMQNSSGLFPFGLFFGYRSRIEETPAFEDASRLPVIVLQADGDEYPDLLGASVQAAGRAWWKNQGQRNPLFEKITNDAILQERFQDPLDWQRFALAGVPSISGFTDIDGDCRADLLIGVSELAQSSSYAARTCSDPLSPTCLPTHLELWINEGSFFRLQWRRSLPVGAHRVSFIDFDSDGNTDIVVSLCHPFPTCNILNGFTIYLNKQASVCGVSSTARSTAPGGCRSSSNMCSRRSFDFDDFSDATTQSVDRLFFEFPSSTHAVVEPDGNRNVITPISLIRFGDINLDGYPDATLVTYNPSSRSYSSILLINSPCSFRGIDSSSDLSVGCSGNGRSLPFSQASVSELSSSTSDPGIASFFPASDLNVVSLYSGSPDRGFGLSFIRGLDALFVRVLVTNGVCQAWCSSGSRFPSPKPIAPSLGASAKLTIQSLFGDLQIFSANGLSQVSAGALDSSTASIGVGRTNNFVEKLAVGIPVPGSNSRTFENLLPNSLFIVYTYPLGSPSGWTLELFISPGDYLLWVSMAVLIAVVLSAIPVIALDCQERAADEREKKENVHYFSLDAL